MRSKRILVGVNNDLLTDARVHKVCMSLERAGYGVCLIGRASRERTLLEERTYDTHRFALWARGGPWLYAEFNIRLGIVLFRRKGDAILCNDTDALPACYVVAWLKRLPLIFDAHELFPELPEVVARQWVRRVWRCVEDLLFPRLKYTYTVCRSIADYYKERYGLQMAVVRNIPQKEAENRLLKPVDLNCEGKRILLYQGAVNVGRGVEWVIEAMKFLPECVFVICGEGDCLSEIKKLAFRSKCRERILFTGRIPQEELKRYTMQADLGFVLLEKLGLSYYYALPNRIFDYMRFGVPVLATRFPEIARVVEESRSGTLITHNEPEYLAQEIRRVLEEWSDPLRRIRLKEAAQKYSWENEEKVMLQVVERALTGE